MLAALVLTLAFAAGPAPRSLAQAPSPAPTATPNPDILFTRARAALAKRSYPRAMSYLVGIETQAGSIHVLRHYKTAFRAATGTLAAHSISVEENANPNAPHGINISLFAAPLNPEDEHAFGVPRLSPEYTFGLVPYAPILPSTGLSATFALPVDGASMTPSEEADAAFPFSVGTGGTLPVTPSGAATATPAPTPLATGRGGLRQIGSATTVFKIYDISYLGEVKIGSAVTWHLRLRPLFNPGRYRVRDIYMDESSDQPLRIRTEGNFTLKGLGCYWDIDFQQVDGRWFIAKETADQAVDGYDSIVVTFSDFRALDERDESLNFGVSGTSVTDVIEEP